ncbi:2'-5' RNA ligase family protein [Flavobacterium sp.]|uniref:2'-5' RNA ligase family protein n=1 Tax=Flavobacterium sp. TaxID=239 RepID=UPI002608D683|nr:2'-5' RNA ligase family protein [Flavobacterium sp.]
MKSLYSIAIHPPEDLITSIKTMKEELATKIGWFNSKNSIAHITLNEFEATDTDMVKIKKQLADLCDTLHPTEVHCDSFGSYPNNGAFFIAPDDDSKKNLKVIMKHINDNLKVTAKFKSSEPHISIARRLTSEKLAVAHAVFPSIAVSFVCESVVIRKFNLERKQFEVIDTFIFNGNEAPPPVQGTLF